MASKPTVPDAGQPPDGYERHKEAARTRQAEQSRTGRDIAPIPEVADTDRRAAAEASFRTFCEAYFRATFSLAWSPDHLKVIARIEQAVLRGGLFALAMPRGSGKTTLCECACIWAVLCGHRSFVALIGAEAGHASEMLESIKTELETNDLLVQDFPEVCYPIARLEGIANRASGQICNGQQTRIDWTAQQIILPTIQGSRASGAILKVAGITGRIRGMKHKRADGQSVRPDLVIIDDPQTDESARSRSQCAAREAILAGAVLGLSGPGKRIAGVMPCTVVFPHDMADSILDRKKHPEWAGERMKMVYRWPDREDLWQRYGDLRSEGLQAGDDGAAATAFYRQHRQEMDGGAEVAWPERFEPHELSAIQHAWNRRLMDEAAFFAECQNEPKNPETEASEELTADQIAGKINRMERGIAPLSATRLTSFIDVQGSMLYWMVAAWENDFTGYIIDYGTYPDQGQPYFSLRSARRTLEEVHPGGIEGRLYAALETLTGQLLTRPWQRDDETELRIGQCLVDANWGTSTQVVYQFCRQSQHAAVLLPSHGKYIGATTKPMHEWAKKPGERAGPGWRISPSGAGKPVRHVVYDTNHWKSFAHARLAVSMGDRGCLSLFGDRPRLHELLADHLTAERRERVKSRGREVDEWHLRTEKPDNHWLDCLVGCAVAASVLGCELAGVGTGQALGRTGSRRSFREEQRQARQRRGTR